MDIAFKYLRRYNHPTLTAHRLPEEENETQAIQLYLFINLFLSTCIYLGCFYTKIEHTLGTSVCVEMRFIMFLTLPLQVT